MESFMLFDILTNFLTKGSFVLSNFSLSSKVENKIINTHVFINYIQQQSNHIWSCFKASHNTIFMP